MRNPPKILITFTPVLLAILLCGWTTSTAWAQKNMKVDLILTGNSSNLFPVISLDPPVKDTAAKFEEELAKAKKAKKNAILVEAGNFVSLRSEQETAYNYPSLKLFDRMEYDVVNLSPRDAVLSMTTNYGFAQGPEKFRKPVITALESGNPGPLGFPISRRIEAGKGSVSFVNLSDPMMVSGLSGKVAMIEPVDQKKSDEAIMAARSAGDLVVALAGVPPERINELLGKADGAPHLLVDLSLPSDVAPMKTGSTWVIPAPAGGEIFTLGLETDEAGSLLQPEIKRTRALTATQYAGLLQIPKPEIGLGIPNLDSVVSDYFQMKADSTRIDRVNASDLQDLTTISDPKVYHVVFEGKPCRLYRVFFHLKEPDYPEQWLNGWPRFDYLVLLDDQSGLVRIYNRTKFPVGGQDTTLHEALSKLAGKPVESWQPDPRLAAGIEEMWDAAVMGLRQTMELDRKLYGPGGPYSRAR